MNSLSGIPMNGSGTLMFGVSPCACMTEYFEGGSVCTKLCLKHAIEELLYENGTKVKENKLEESDKTLAI